MRPRSRGQLKENVWDRLDSTERRFVNYAVRGMSDRQIAAKCGSTASYVSKRICTAKKRLEVTGDSKRALTHWYWTAGPGYDETRMSALQDALREMTLVAASVKAFHLKITARYEGNSGKESAQN